jgi:Uma2 family endonuclease
MPAAPKVRYTYEDYLATPEDSAHRYEVVAGELFVTAAPRWRHQQVVGNVHGIIRDLALDHALGEAVTGPITVRLADDTVLEPDVVFLRADRLDLIDSGRIHGPPDLVVEVLSPSNRDYDRTLKRKRYLASGVAELWIIDPDENALEVWRPGAVEPDRPRDEVRWRVGEHTFDIPLSEIFRR